jgi:predicted ATPase
MVKSFFCKNYKNIDMDETLKFSHINILLGANNCGKSNFLEALSLPSDVIENGLHDVLQRNGSIGIPNRYHDSNDTTFDYVLELRDTNGEFVNLEYKMVTYIDRERPSSFYLKEEKLSYEKPRGDYEEPFNFFKCHSDTAGVGSGLCSFNDSYGGHTRRKIDVNEKDTFFRQTHEVMESLDKDDRNSFIDDINPMIKQITDYVSSWCHYSMSRISVSDAIKPSKLIDSDTMLAIDGTNLQNLLRIFFNNDHIEEIEKFLSTKQIIKGLSKIKPIVLQSEYSVVELRIEGQTFKLSEMSDGTIRMILLAVLMLSQIRSNTIFVDEPEINIHPAWQKLIYELVKTHADDTQFFISTHSPDLLDKFTNDYLDGTANVFVFNNGKITNLNTAKERLRQKINDDGWELGDLYRVGDPIIGGWPW